MSSEKTALNALALLVAITPSFSFASTFVDPSVDEGPPLQEPVVVRGNRVNDERRESTTSKIVVSRDEIDRFGDSNLLDILKRLPDITVIDTPGRRSGAEIQMRGLGPGYTAVLLDGERIPAGLSFDTIAPDMVERIEISKSATADQTTRAIAGSINIILRQSFRKSQREIKTTISREYGGTATLLTGNFGFKKDDISYSLTSSYRHATFAWQPRATQISTDDSGEATNVKELKFNSNGRNNILTLLPRITWTPNESDSVNFQAFVNHVQESTYGVQTSRTSRGPESDTDRIGLLTQRDISTLRSRLNWTRKLSQSARVEVKGGFSFNSLVRNEDYEYVKHDSIFRQIDVVSPSTQRMWTVAAKYIAPFIKDHLLSTGLEAERTGRSDLRGQSDVAFGKAGKNGVENFDTEITRFAFYVQDDWEVSSRWSIYQGVRWEGIKTMASNEDATNTNQSSVISNHLKLTWNFLP